MACTVDHRRLYCTTSDVSFGPLFESDEEGEEFRSWMYKNHGDPREFGHNTLSFHYEHWKREKLMKTHIIRRREGETLSDYVTRWLETEREMRAQDERDLDRRRMDDMQRACGVHDYPNTDVEGT